MPLLVFPEGGRSADGQVKPFLGGAFYVAIKAGVPVVPMAIVGSFEAVPMNCLCDQAAPVVPGGGRADFQQGIHPRAMDQLAAITQKAVEDLYYARSEVSDPRVPGTLPATITPARS